MATWQDGPEYAPLVPPSGYEPAGPPTPVNGPDPAPEDTGPEVAPAARPGFEPPESSIPLDSLAPPPMSAARDPHVPFAVASRTTRAGSAWQSSHVPGTQPAPAGPPTPGQDLSVPYPEPPYPEVPYAPTPYGLQPPHDPATPYPPVAPPPTLPHPEGADLAVRERAARWLLGAAGIYFLGTWTGPLVIAAVILAALMVMTRPGVRPAAKLVSRIALGLVVGVCVVTVLAGDGLAAATPLARAIGLVHAFLCVMWFVRERSEIDAERQRRERERSSWPPPPDHHSWPGPGPYPPEDHR
ncbi:hypothetical protein GA0111570_102108 [Raineyella antarctica]|uniref:Uncharacterized protein n=1 Tax=Raineyella antarctica TaxID=1577474 RepID=A0A1G6GEC0_9ACTN|nr:hypothetical protein [Raineyella antarctica]SDB80320.1 hypothetical protein GA0111570_102108 [Raineyella antarctica]